LLVVLQHPRIDRHIGNGVLTGDVKSFAQLLLQNAIQMFGFHY
jgi:hypothetical protein